MSQQELLKKIVGALDRVGIEYTLTGSFASSLQGEPRSTHDIDFVVALQLKAVKELVRVFPPADYHLDDESIIDAIKNNGMFNLIAVNTGDKVDFWMLTDEAFDRSRFARKYVEEIMGMHIRVSSPEDTILAKLKWAKLSGGSEKQFTDALRVYEVQFGKLNMDYLQKWAKELGVESMLQRIQKEAEVI